MMESLNERQRTIVYHVYWEGKTHMETARKMGYRSTSAVTNVVGRALKKMRRKAGDITDKKVE